MKKLTLALTLFFTAFSTIAQQAISADYLHSQPVRFVENKGQMTDMDGNPVNHVLFKAEAPHVNLYVTEKGLTYFFLKFEKHKQTDHLKRMAFENTADDSTTLQWNRIDMSLKGAAIKKENIVTEGKSTEFFQYFLGHCPDGIKDVHQYNKVTIKDIYKGIDWVLYNSNEGGFEYDFIVHPNANPKEIELVYSSQNPLTINRTGGIDIQSELGLINENAPVSFQEGKEIKTEFNVTASQKNDFGGYTTNVQFALENYNPKQNLIIDPKLVWATFYGGNDVEYVWGSCIDKNNNYLISGKTKSINFPTQNAGSFYQGTKSVGFDMYVVKFNNSGVRLWATYYGGSASESCSVGVDQFNNIFLYGESSSPNFPLQNAGTYFDGTYGLSLGFSQDAVIVKFDENGNRLWATYFGGDQVNLQNNSSDDLFNHICFDSFGNIYLSGLTSATNFPLLNSGGFFQGITGGGIGDNFITKFSNTGTLLWSTYYSGDDDQNPGPILTDSKDNLYLIGDTYSSNFPLQNNGGFFQGTHAGITGNFDLSIVKFDKNGNRLWATLYGGSDNEFLGPATIDKEDNLYVFGNTQSTDLPTQNSGAFFQGTNFLGQGIKTDGFILKFDTNNNRLWATYFGGSADDQISTAVVDSCNNLYIGGPSSSDNLPMQSYCGTNGYNRNYRYPHLWYGDYYISRFSQSDELQWSTFFGGDGLDGGSNSSFTLALDSSNNLFTAGLSANIPTPSTYTVLNPGNGAYFDDLSLIQDDALYITKFSPDALKLSSSQVNPSNCVCDGSISVTTDCSSPPFTYKWSTGAVYADTNASSASITNLCAGNYWVEVTSHCNGKDTLYFTITSPSGILSANNTITNSTCEKNNGSAHISIKGGSKPYTFSWSPAVSIDSIANNLNEGTYVVSINDNSCIPISLLDTITISTTPQPLSDFTFVENLSCEGISSSFTNSSVNANTYSWSFGDGSSSIEKTPIHFFPTYGVYNVSLISSASSCIDTITKSIALSTGSNLSLLPSNVFTPNNDGYNDCFSPMLNGTNSSTLQECIQLEIYDRWGLKVFESSNGKSCWNGLNYKNNLMCAGGTYYYVARFEKSRINGYVSIIK